MQQPRSESVAEIWRVGILLEASFLEQLQESPLRVLACPVPSNSFSLDEGDAIAVCKQHLLGTYEHANEYTTPRLGSGGYELKQSQLKRCKYPSVAVAAAEVLDTSVEELSDQLNVDLTTFVAHIGLSRPVTATLLLVSRHFLKVYGFFSQECVWFRQITPVPLSQVTLVPVLEGTETPSEQQLEESVRGQQLEESVRGQQLEESVRGQQLEESVRGLYAQCQRKTVTVQQGFNLVFRVHCSPTMFAVTEASPVLQGKITDQTVITVLPSDPSSPASPSKPDPSSPSSSSKPRRKGSGKRVSKTPVREDSDGEMYFDAEDAVGGLRRTGSGASASDFPSSQFLSLPESSREYHTQVTSVGNFRLQSQYIVLPRDAATSHNVYHCQTVWVCAAREEERSNRTLSNLVLPLHCVKAEEKKEGEEEEEEEGERMHLAVAILYENESELEKYVPPGALGGPLDRSAQGHAFIHPNLLFFLFPETLSSTRKFFVTIKRITDPEIPLVKHCRISHVQQPVKQAVDLTETFTEHLIDKSFLLSVGEVLSIPTNSGKIYGIVEMLEPSMNGAADLGKEWECTIPGPKSSTYLPDLVPPSPLLPTPSYWEQLQPAGLEGYCETLFSYFIPLLGEQRANCPPSSVLVSGPPGSGKKLVVRAVARQCRMHVLECNCYEFSSDVVAYAEKNFVHHFIAALECAPVVLILNQIHMLGRKSDTQEEVRLSVEFEKAMGEVSKFNRAGHYPVMVVGVTSRPHSVPLRVHGNFLHHLEMAAPSLPQRADMLTALSREHHLSPEVDFEDLAKRTAGFVLGDFVALFSHASHLAFRDVTKHCLSSLGWHTSEDLAIAGVVVTPMHMETALATLHSAHSDAIGAPKIPSVRWEDVGGLAEAKQEILDTIQLPLLHPELFTAGLRRSGVLLYGAPGTGKTLLAKAVATECSLNFLSVKGPELINMYVGQSEENIREVFTRARSAAPCVIFFDELDSIAPNRGKSGDSGGVMDRVVSQLLSELDGLQRLEDVFVIGATNRPDLLDPALLRPGRFDRLVYLGVSEDMEAKLKILKAITRKFNLSEDVELSVVASRCPSNLTGADLYALCSDATLVALRRQIDSMEQQGMSDDEWEGVLTVTQEDFLEALEKLTPSVSAEELQRYKDIKKTMVS